MASEIPPWVWALVGGAGIYGVWSIAKTISVSRSATPSGPDEADPSELAAPSRMINETLPTTVTGDPLSSASYPVPDGPTTGYVRGQPRAIHILHVDGNIPLESNTQLAFEAMREDAAAQGVHIRLLSGFRTMAHQQALYNAYREGRGALAARPGFSNHQMGNAMDVNWRDPGVLNWFNRHARAYNVYRTVMSEPWHWEFLGPPITVPIFS